MSAPKCTFLKSDSWKIIPSNIPKYTQFPSRKNARTSFTHDFNPQVIRCILETENNVIAEATNKSVVDICIQKQQIEKLLNSMKGTTLVTQYQHSCDADVGRIYPKKCHSPIPLPRWFKHTLFELHGWKDIDAVKGHPTIAIEMAKRINLKLPFFENYLSNGGFDAIAEKLCDHYTHPTCESYERVTPDDVKLLINLHIYGGDFANWIYQLTTKRTNNGETPRKLQNNTHQHTFIKELKNDCDTITKKIRQDNQELFNLIKNPKLTEKENLSNLASMWFQIIEFHALCVIKSYLQASKFVDKLRNHLPEHDGICFKPLMTIENEESVIRDINLAITQNMGLRLTFSFKSYTKNALTTIVDSMQDEMNEFIPIKFVANDEANNNSLVFSDTEAMHRLGELYNYTDIDDNVIKLWVTCCDTLYVFDKNTGMWCNDSNIQLGIIQKYEKQLMIGRKSTFGKDEKDINTGKSYGNDLKKMQNLLTLMKTYNVDNNWIKNNGDSSLGKLLFNNGYFDFTRKVFIPKDKVNDVDEYGFNPKFVFMVKIDHDWDYTINDDSDYVKDVRRKLFYQTYSKEVGNYVMELFAMALAGKIMKLILFCVGGTNSGKSTLTNAIKKSCGNCFASFDANNLVDTKKSGDMGQQMRPFYLQRYKRGLIANELPSHSKLNATLIKNLTGSDGVEGREHGGNETAFNPHFLMTLFSNDFVEFNSMDSGTTSRIRILHSMYSYVDEPDPKNKFELQKDDSFIQSFDTLEFKQAMVRILVGAYMEYLERGKQLPVPLEMETLKDEANLSEKRGGIISNLLDDFIITGDEKDYVPREYVENMIKEKKLGVTTMKVFTELNKYCKIHDFALCTSGQERVPIYDGASKTKKVTVWYGVKEIKDDDCDNDNNNTE